ncbi:acyltransferase domain-containing protein [Streptomyces sp. Ncost-T10-10d]|uniref:acyltransferase domain-containing protein n=1 Tax=Streptomyces sp. Ncost-T10-10d TaxID=1839774 RepID=UPI00210AF724|nr:acyltransferase domain-containing protein [Streptomyces sp. Ncost-T10-10d]
MTSPHRRSLVLMFPGTGAQHARMAAGLYGYEPVFTDAVDSVLSRLGPEGCAVRKDWLADAPAETLDADTRSAPLLFAVDYAMGRLVESWGVRPAAYLGHSMGEFAAAVLAGVFGLDDAMRLLWQRVMMQRTTPAGGMLAVAASEQELSGYLGDGVVVGAVNAPRHTVLSGPEEPLRRVAERLAADGRTCRRLASRTPYHSPALAPLVPESEALIGGLRLARPHTPLYSAYTTRLLSDEEAVSPAFWAVQPMAPVLFGPTLDRVLREGDRLLVEAGPSQSLAVLARGHRAVRSGRSAVVSTLPPRAMGPGADRRSVRAARGELLAGTCRPQEISAPGHSGRLPVDLPVS